MVIIHPIYFEIKQTLSSSRQNVLRDPFLTLTSNANKLGDVRVLSFLISPKSSLLLSVSSYPFFSTINHTRCKTLYIGAELNLIHGLHKGQSSTKQWWWLTNMQRSLSIDGSNNNSKLSFRHIKQMSPGRDAIIWSSFVMVPCQIRVDAWLYGAAAIFICLTDWFLQI